MKERKRNKFSLQFVVVVVVVVIIIVAVCVFIDQIAIVKKSTSEQNI